MLLNTTEVNMSVYYKLILLLLFLSAKPSLYAQNNVDKIANQTNAIFPFRTQGFESVDDLLFYGLRTPEDDPSEDNPFIFSTTEENTEKLNAYFMQLTNFDIEVANQGKLRPRYRVLPNVSVNYDSEIIFNSCEPNPKPIKCVLTENYVAVETQLQWLNRKNKFAISVDPNNQIDELEQRKKLDKLLNEKPGYSTYAQFFFISLDRLKANNELKYNEMDRNYSGTEIKCESAYLNKRLIHVNGDKAGKILELSRNEETYNSSINADETASLTLAQDIPIKEINANTISFNFSTQSFTSRYNLIDVLINDDKNITITYKSETNDICNLNLVIYDTNKTDLSYVKFKDNRKNIKFKDLTKENINDFMDLSPNTYPSIDRLRYHSLFSQFLENLDLISTVDENNLKMKTKLLLERSDKNESGD